MTRGDAPHGQRHVFVSTRSRGRQPARVTCSVTVQVLCMPLRCRRPRHCQQHLCLVSVTEATWTTCQQHPRLGRVVTNAESLSFTGRADCRVPTPLSASSSSSSLQRAAQPDGMQPALAPCTLPPAVRRRIGQISSAGSSSGHLPEPAKPLERTAAAPPVRRNYPPPEPRPGWRIVLLRDADCSPGAEPRQERGRTAAAPVGTS